MGMTMSKFGTLYSQQDDLCSMFPLTAIVVHDPSDRAFVRRFNQDFGMMSEATGSTLLFVSFVERTEPFHSTDNFSLEYGIESLNADRESYDDDFMADLLDMLNASNAQLPFLAVTTSLKNSAYSFVPTRADSVCRQLLALSQLGSDLRHADEISVEDLSESIRGLGMPCASMEAVEPIGLGLLSQLAPISAGGFEMESSLAQEVVKHSENRLESQMRNSGPGKDYEASRMRLDNYREAVSRYEKKSFIEAKSECLMDDPPRLKRSLMRKDMGRKKSFLRSYLQEAFCDSYLTPEYSINNVINEWAKSLHIDMRRRQLQCCDMKSKNYIKRYNNNLCSAKRKIFSNDEDAMISPSRNLILFCEHELNRSVAQMMRACMGIEMPQYYMLHKPTSNPSEFQFSWNKGRGCVGLNANYPGKLLEIGKIWSGYKNMYGAKVPHPELFEWLGDDFCQNIYNVNGFRNKYLFHSGEESFEREHFGNLVISVQQIISIYLGKMNGMKTRFGS